VVHFDESDLESVDASLVDYVHAVYAARECPRLPNEWLSQPWLFIRAAEFLSPYISDFSERRAAMKERESNG